MIQICTLSVRYIRKVPRYPKLNAESDINNIISYNNIELFRNFQIIYEFRE